MKFYREKELNLLQKIEERSKQSAQMTFVVGRRRIGKTSLLVKAAEGRPMLYFFVSKKNEVLLCEEFVQEIRHKLQVEVFGELKTFKSVFGYLMELSKAIHFTLVIDEFQEFNMVNPSVYSDMQKNEIDIVAVNDLNKSVTFAEVKRKKENISIPELINKAKNIQAQLKDYRAEFVGLAIEDM